MKLENRESRVLISGESVFHIREDLWKEVIEYREDYKIVIKQREFRRLSFCHQSPQLLHRREVVEYLKNLAIDKKMSHCCLHLAVYLLDIFMDNHAIDPDKLCLVANVCLLLAAKVEGINANAIKLSELNSASKNVYSIEDHKILEVAALKFFDWYVMYPTTATYSHYYLQSVMTVEEVKFLQKISGETSEGIFLELHGKVCIYLDKVIDDVHFMQYYTPSMLAAAVIAAARLRMGLRSWNDELTFFTDFTSQDICDCLINLLKFELTDCHKCFSLNQVSKEFYIHNVI